MMNKINGLNIFQLRNKINYLSELAPELEIIKIVGRNKVIRPILYVTESSF